MGIFDFFSGKKKEKERQEQLRIQQEQKRHAEEKRKIAERQKLQEQKRQEEKMLSNFDYDSTCHQRYENGRPVRDLQICQRYIKIRKNTNGCSGYQLTNGDGYILTATNGETGKPQFAPKPMRVVKFTDAEILLKGYTVSAQTPFGWQEIDLSDYGFSIIRENGTVKKCVLHLYDRNINIEYAQTDKETPLFDEKVSISAIAQGSTFNLRFSSVNVIKQFYNGLSEKIEVSPNAFANIIRKQSNGMTSFDISNIAELREKNILLSNPSITPSFSYNSDEDGSEFASAEINNTFAAINSGKEYVSLFQITRQKGKVIAFIINNLPNEGDFYYLIIFQE